MSTAFFTQLLADRRIELDYEYAIDGQSDEARRVREIAAAFLERYATFAHLTPEQAVASYIATTRRYARDIRQFIATGQYPLELDSTTAPLGRLDYDLFLILTILLTRHRCALMEELAHWPARGRALVVGVGSGIELDFIHAPQGGDAFDVSIAEFVRATRSGWRWREELFTPRGDRYDSVYAIELLEHLEAPFAFLGDCREVLLPGGRIVVSTATNVPQFDHTVNFLSDDEFERRASTLGLRVVHRRVIPHAYPRTDIGARNTFYVLERG